MAGGWSPVGGGVRAPGLLETTEASGSIKEGGNAKAETAGEQAESACRPISIALVQIRRGRRMSHPCRRIQRIGDAGRRYLAEIKVWELEGGGSPRYSPEIPDIAAIQQG